MKKFLHHYCLAGFLLMSYSFNCQIPSVIKIKKNPYNFYFYQKGEKRDTISSAKGNEFYLIASDSLKSVLSIEIENGYLIKTANDSIYNFKYIKGMKYECIYKNTVRYHEKNSGPELKSLVNGVSSESPKKIIFYFKTNKESKPFLENRFYYKE